MPCHTKEGERFTEELVVRPLPSGHLLVHFHFHLSTSSKRHHEVFPKAISQLTSTVSFHELELSLSHGRWHYKRWGSPLIPAKPSGAELRASFSPSEPALAQQWGNLSHALSGLFCASLNFLARPELTAQQAICMGPAGPAPAQHVWLYAALPKEAVCTENLTPWLRLLPCRDQQGIAALLRSRPTLYGADYHSMGVRIQVDRTPSGTPTTTRLTQTLSLVLRPATQGSKQQQLRPVPLPAVLPNWDLTATMGAQLGGSCPLASYSKVYVQLPQEHGHMAEQLAALLNTSASDAGNGSVTGNHQTDDAQQESTVILDAAPPALSLHDQGNVPPSQWQTQAFSISPAPDEAVVASVVGRASHDEHAVPSHAFLVYDLHARRRRHARLQRVAQKQQARAGDAAGAAEGAQQQQRQQEQQQQEHVGLELSQVWADGINKGQAAAAKARPLWDVHRYITGYGNMNGGMVLELHAAASKSSEAQATAGSSSSSSGMDGMRHVCIFQIVPWYIRVWLHTLRLNINGQPADLDVHMKLRHISPARDRELPLVLELCLALPAHITSASLSASYSKGFLTVFEYPPDAHRGFDIPAAIITFPGSDSSSSSRIGSCSSSKSSHTGGCAGNMVWATIPCGGVASTTTTENSSSSSSVSSCAGGAMLSPLLEQLAQPTTEQVYSEGLLVQLAPPDFSMPYNVICLTSTVLAVFIGATLNTLLRRPEGTEDKAVSGAAGSKSGWSSPARRKAVKFVVVLLLFGGLGLYLDPSLQEALQDGVKAAGKLLGVELPQGMGA